MKNSTYNPIILFKSIMVQSKIDHRLNKSKAFNILKTFLHVLILMISIIFTFQAHAIDCRQHMNIGSDLHLSKPRADLNNDSQLMIKIKNHYERALKLCPDLCYEKPALCNNLGDIYLRMGMTDKALIFFKKVIQIKPSTGEALFELGSIYEQKQLFGSSLDYYLRAIEVNPNDIEAKERAKNLAKNQNCSVRSVEKGEKLSQEQIRDALICQKTFQKARKIFKLKHRAIGLSYVILRNISFEIGSAKLNYDSYDQLKLLSSMMLENPDINLSIDGHTDDLPVKRSLEVIPGKFCTSNECLSKARAESVQAYLNKHGISTYRMNTKGYGSTKPFAPKHVPGCVPSVNLRK